MSEQLATPIIVRGSGLTDPARSSLDEALARLQAVVAATEALSLTAGLPVALARNRGAVYVAMDALGGWINEFLASQPPAAQIEAAQARITGLIRAWSRTGPFFDRSYSKLRGYPGDYETYEIIYNGRPGGADAPAQILDDYYLHTRIARALRARPAYLADRLGQSIRKWEAQERTPVRVLSLCCGPARELVLLATDPASNKAVTVTCLDQDPEALRYVRNRLTGQWNGRVSYVRADVLRFAREPLRPSLPFHMIYAAGLFDHLADELAAQLLQDCYGLLVPGGHLLVSSLSAAAPANELALFQWLLEWPLVCRGEAALRQLFAFTAFPPAGLRFEPGPSALNLFVQAERP